LLQICSENLSYRLSTLTVTREQFFEGTRRQQESRPTSIFYLLPIGFMALSPKRSTAMHSGVAYGTKRDQVLLRIIAKVAAKFLVVDLKN
jgi:hypothetical protein